MSGRALELSGASLPHRLADLQRPPQRVYLLGELPRGPSVAVVGTRHPTVEAVCFAEQLAADLVRRDVAVLSGGAAGIDSAAHRGALAAGGTTVVVAPAGYTAPFPEQNRGLFAQILEAGGAYLSLVPETEPARSAAFFARNASLVALAHAVVLVEAPFRSGARNAARWARSLGRPLLVVPSAPWNERGTGSLLELRRGAKLCTRAQDVFDELERVLLSPLAAPRHVAAATQAELPFNGASAHLGTHSEMEVVRKAIAAGALHVDAICERTGLPAGAVQNHVLTLTLEGALAPDPSGQLQLGSFRAGAPKRTL